jgi:hypothetical protein
MSGRRFEPPNEAMEDDMQTLTGLSVSLALLALAFGHGAHAGESPVTSSGHWECRSVPPTGTVYFSAIFDITGGSQGIEGAYKQFLHDKYGYNGAASCSMAYAQTSTVEKLQADQKSYVAQLGGQDVKAVETGWKFDSSSAVSYICYGGVSFNENGQRTTDFYLSPVTQVTGGTVDRLLPAWKSYLNGLHAGALVNPSMCQVPPLDSAQRDAWQQSFEQQWKGMAKIVHSDWKFDPGTAPAPETPNPHG